MRRRMKVIANVTVGEPQVNPAAQGHVTGVFEGNRPHRLQRHKGIERETAATAEGTARRSTGIRPGKHDTIDPRMPKLSPA